MTTKSRNRPAKRAPSSSSAATDAPSTETAERTTDARTDALNAAGADDDSGPQSAGEYFARCARPITAPATIGDIVSVLEHFGLTDRATPATAADE